MNFFDATSVAAMNPVCGRIIRVGVSDAVGADALHDSAILTPVLGPFLHVVIARVMNAAMLPLAFGLWVHEEDAIRADELVAFHFAHDSVNHLPDCLPAFPAWHLGLHFLLGEDVIPVGSELFAEVVAWS